MLWPEEKKNIITALIEEYDIHTAEDIQDALKEMMETEMDQHLGYESYERSNNSNSRNGYKAKSVRDNHIIRKLVAYVILGVTMDDHKEVLSMQVGQNESSKYWLGVLNELKNRGVKLLTVMVGSIFLYGNKCFEYKDN